MTVRESVIRLSTGGAGQTQFAKGEIIHDIGGLTSANGVIAGELLGTIGFLGIASLVGDAASSGALTLHIQRASFGPANIVGGIILAKFGAVHIVIGFTGFAFGFAQESHGAIAAGLGGRIQTITGADAIGVFAAFAGKAGG